MAGFEIHHDVIEQMMQEMQESFNRHPIRVPVEADGSIGGTTVYNGPVIHGDANGARLAWGNRNVDQSQTGAQQITPGFEPVAQAITIVLAGLANAGLSVQDQQDAQDAAEEALLEVTKQDPNPGRIRRALATLKWILTPIATGAAAGAADGAHDWAKTAIEHLTLPF
jgi:hypothetical protein